MFFPFVILEHSGWVAGGRGDHWDWLLDFPQSLRVAPNPSETGIHDLPLSGLVSFACDRSPELGWEGCRLRRMPLHRREYLTYEGPVSGNRGQVKRMASGQIEWLSLDRYSLRFRLVTIEFLGEASGAWPIAAYGAWPVAHYCLAACDQVHATGRPWYHSEPDPTPLWQLQIQR